MTVPQVRHAHHWLHRQAEDNNGIDQWSCRCGLVSFNNPGEWTADALDPPTSMSFDEWLVSTATLQRDHFDITFPFEEDKVFADYVQTNLFALTSEVVEMGGEVGWKPWATDRGWVNRDEFIGEAVDAMHFLANLLCSVGCTGAELTNAYRMKQQVNRERQANNYTTRDKTDYVR